MRAHNFDWDLYFIFKATSTSDNVSFDLQQFNRQHTTYTMRSSIVQTAAILLLVALCGSSAFGQQVAQRNICTGRRTGTFVRDVRDCRSYFYCNPNGAAEQSMCPVPFHFDEARQMCNWQNQVQCFACPAAQNFVNLAVAGTCDQYVRCVHQEPEHRMCPADLRFDARIGQCNLPEAVTCPVAEPVPVCPARDDPNNPVFIRDEENCRNYIVCLHGTPTNRQCPEGLHFNLKIRQCDRPANAGCLPAGDPSFDCSTAPVLTPPLHANPNDCRSYFVCANGVSILEQCAEGTSWNQQVQNCVIGSESCTAQTMRW